MPSVRAPSARLRRLLVMMGTVGLTAVTYSSRAGAEAPRPTADVPPEILKTHAERRSGVVFEGNVAGGIAKASGYPNNATFVGDPAYFSSSDLLYGTTQTFFLGGALTDYLNFGVWFGWGNYESSAWRSTGYGIGFRAEAFPLYGVAPALRDLGVFGNFGLGGATLATKREGNFPTSDGTQSFLGVGAFYEWTLLRGLGGHFAAGPTLEYDAIFSRSISRHGGNAGLRLVFYTGK